MLNFVFYSQLYNDLSVNLPEKAEIAKCNAGIHEFFLRGAFTMSIGDDPGRGRRKYQGAIYSAKIPSQAYGKPIF